MPTASSRAQVEQGEIADDSRDDEHHRADDCHH